MEQVLKYCEAVCHILVITNLSVGNLGQAQRAAEAAGYTMMAFNGLIWARDDDAGGRWVKTPLTLNMLRC